jgi:hypothetical protein
VMSAEQGARSAYSNRKDNGGGRRGNVSERRAERTGRRNAESERRHSFKEAWVAERARVGWAKGEAAAQREAAVECASGEAVQALGG